MALARLSEELSAEQNVVMRPASRPYIVFGIIWGGSALLSFARGLSYPASGLLQASCICASLLVIFWAFIASHEIGLHDRTLRYRSFPRGTVVVPFDAIRDAKLGRITLAGGIRSFGFQTVLIRFNRNEHRKPVVINARMFDTKDMLRLIEMLQQAGVDATVEGGR